MKVYVLFQTNQYRSRTSRLFCGVFSTHEQAKMEAEENDLAYLPMELYDIVEVELDKFEEA